MKNHLALLLLVLLSVKAQAFWNLNDVSYLMPLPSQIGEDQLLKMHSPARGGPLLNPAFIGTIPPLTPVLSEGDMARSLRVVAVRIDPCFPLPTPQSCQKQLRLVWQPLEVGFKKRVQTVDAALHSFYVLSDEDFDRLLADLSQWKSHHRLDTTGLSLQIHPAWATQGDQSPALLDFNRIVSKYAGHENLSRLTVMVLRGAGDMWAFAGFEVKNGQLQLLTVPRLERKSQAFINMAVPADHFDRGVISPLPGGEDTFSKVITNSENVRVGHEELLHKELRALHRIENPHIFNPENMDCVSCHVAQPARVWLENNRRDLALSSSWQQHAYKNPRHNLNNISPALKNTQIIRAFGYFGDSVAISQRVIHESAEVADTINRYLAQKRPFN